MRRAILAVFVLFVPAAALIPQVQAQTASLAAAPKPAPVCLRQDMVWGWKVVDDKTLIVTDKVRKSYTVSLKPGCFDLKWPMHLGFKSYSGFGISCLTRNDYVIVPPQAGMPPQRCFIADIQPYTGAPAPSAQDAAK
jgi:hypothetical protein